MTTRIFAGAGHWTGGPDAGKGGGMFSRTLGDGGWQRVGGGLPADAEVRAIALRPGDPKVIYAGTQHGPYRSTDGGERWTALPLPDPGMVVWSFLFEPGNPRVMYVGTAPTAVYKSADGGDSWKRLSALRAPGQVKMSFATRVIGMTADPARPQEIYAGLEVDGVVRSLDGGETWEDCSADLARLSQRPHLKSRIVSDTDMEGMLDSHALCMSSAQPGTVFLAVRMGLFRSGDRGKSWEDMEVGRFSPLTYARNVQVSSHDARTLYAALSPAARSDAGTVVPVGRPRAELAALRSRHHRTEHDDDAGAARQGSGPGVLRDARRAGVRHPGRGQDVERVPATGGDPGRLHRRLRLRGRDAWSSAGALAPADTV